jgi:hypothetical protein
MATAAQANDPDPIELTDEDVSFLLSLLRDPSSSQPLTTQQLIDALRRRGQ